MADEKPAPDWELIEGQYRAGVLSNREIATQHGVTEGAIRKKAKAKGWERDLSAKVAQEVRSQEVRTLVRTAPREGEVRTEREIVEQAALVVAQVAHSHRLSIQAGRETVLNLLGELAGVSLNREELEAAIIAETAEDSSNARRTALLKVMSLPGRAAVARDLAQALKNLIPLERQAYHMDAPIDPEPPKDGAPDPVAERLAALVQRVRALGA